MANIERLQLLVNALASEEYIQGTCALRRDGTAWCCLGVATDLFHKHTGQGEWKSGFAYYTFAVGSIEVSAYMPRQVQEWFGVEDRGPALKLTKPIIPGKDDLSLLNDASTSFEPVIQQLCIEFPELRNPLTQEPK